MFKKYGIWVLISFFIFLYCLYSIIRHLKFETYIFDLGYYDQLIWQFSRGKGIYLSILEANAFTDHFSPTILLLTPLYWIWANPIILLITQVIIICSGAYPLYTLALKKTKHLWFSLTVSFAYLSFYGIQNAIAFDFHAAALSPSLLAWLIWAYESKKLKIFWLTLLLLAGLQENFYILVSAFGLFIAFKYKDYKRGILITLAFFFFFLLLIFYLIPNFFGSPYYYLNKRAGDFELGNLFRMLYYPGSKLDVVFYSFAAFSFLPLLSPPTMILALEEFLGRFLGTTNPNWWILGFHYNAILATIMSYATIDAVSRYFKKHIYYVIIFILLGTLISQLRVNPDIKRVFRKDFYDLSGTTNAKEILKLIPKDASVAATNDLGAQIARREGLIFLTNCIDNPNPIGVDGRRCFKITPDYIAANLDPEDSPNNFYPDYNRESIISYLNYLQKSGEYQIIKKEGDVYLLKKL